MFDHAKKQAKARELAERSAELRRRVRALELASVPHPTGEANRAWRKESDELKRVADALVAEQRAFNAECDAAMGRA